MLVFSKTEGFRHDSIPSGIAAIRQQGTTRGFSVEATEDSNAFTDDSLARFKAVVFLSTTGDVLNPQQQDAFERFIRRGGGFAGVHSASDTEYDWPFYGGLVGAYFAGHPDIQNATVQIEDRGASVHVITASGVEPPRRVVQLPAESAWACHRAGDARRAHLYGRYHGARSSHHVVADL